MTALPAMVDCQPNGEECVMCSAEACNKCGAGCWDWRIRYPEDADYCRHDHGERHEEAA